MSDENVQVFLHSQVDAENSVPGMEDELTRQVPVVSSPWTSEVDQMAAMLSTEKPSRHLQRSRGTASW